jgi:hypothetical protein
MGVITHSTFPWNTESKLKIRDQIAELIYGFTVLLLDLGRFFSFLILYTVGRTPWTKDQPVTRPMPTHRTT